MTTLLVIIRKITHKLVHRLSLFGQLARATVWMRAYYRMLPHTSKGALPLHAKQST
jgi:hypothetical protein